MQKTLPPVLLALAGISIILLFGRVTCNTKNEPDTPPKYCGPEVSGALSWGFTNNLTPEDHFVATDEYWTYYNYAPEKSFENVCANKHVSGSMEVTIAKGYEDRVQVTAEIAYGILYTYTVNQWKVTYGVSFVYKEAEFDFGMKHLYGDDPGWYFPVITVAVVYQGDLGLTHSLCSEAIGTIRISYKHYDWVDYGG